MMKKLNVLIFPTDDRSGQTSLIYHYASRGHRVFIPKFGTLGLNWSRIATWPSLLCKSSKDLTKRNLDIHGFNRDQVIFGEDYFLNSFLQNPVPLYDNDISCEIIDLQNENVNIDVFHTLRGGEAYLQLYFDIAKRHFPMAKWVSSTLNQMSSCPGGFQQKNVAKFIPAPYESHHLNINNVNLMSVDFEAKLLNANIENNERSGFASFNHNFANRQPVDFQIFQTMNSELAQMGYERVPNFGGNIRTQGADIRYSGDNGITGNFETINPKEAYELTSRIRAAIHFKETDWGGGVFYYSLNSETPIITTHRYVNASNSHKYLIDKVNCLLVDDGKQGAIAVKLLSDDLTFSQKLSLEMKEMKKQIFNEKYWENWELFLTRLT